MVIAYNAAELHHFLPDSTAFVTMTTTILGTVINKAQ